MKKPCMKITREKYVIWCNTLLYVTLYLSRTATIAPHSGKLTPHTIWNQMMSQHNFIKTGILLISSLLTIGCTHTTLTDQLLMTVPHPGKYQLTYHTPSQEFPLHSMATIDGREFLAVDDVVLPSVQSLYLLTHWKIFDRETVLDIGTGSGVQAVFAADNASVVVATDINPAAVKMAKLNAKRNGVDDIIDVRQGDLFAPINKDEKFDVILFNINYPYNEATQGLWKLHERFFAEVKNHLKQGGRIYYQSGRIDNIVRINTMATKNGMSILSMRMDVALEADRQPIVYLIQRNLDVEVNTKVWGK